MKELEIQIEKNENLILELERLKTDIESDKLELESKIVTIKNELKVIESTELTREQLMERIRYIKVNKNNDLVVEYH